jgi:hypothetical protein
LTFIPNQGQHTHKRQIEIFFGLLLVQIKQQFWLPGDKQVSESSYDQINENVLIG